MKQRILLFLFMPFAANLSPSFSQGLSIGFQNGTCYSDPHGSFTTGRWESKAGPISSLFINYSLNKFLAVQTEFNYTNQYYSYKTYASESTSNYYPGNSPVANNQNGNFAWDLAFLRIPLFLTVSAGTNLKFSVSAGGYISILASHDGVLPYYPVYEFDDSYYQQNYTGPDPPKFDHGLFYSSSISYPISQHFRAYLSGRYFIGKERYIDYQNFHLGSLEWTAGLAFSGFSKKTKQIIKAETGVDTSSHRFSFQGKTGYSLSWNGGDNNHQSYQSKSSATVGISVSYKLNNYFSLKMDVLFKRMGYFMKDSSSSFFRYSPATYSMYRVDTRIDIDYLQTPLLLKINLGGPLSIYLNTGPYMGMLLNARVAGTANYASSSESGYSYTKTQVYDNIEGILNPTDWGWIYGGGLKIPVFKKYALDIELRYEKGNRNVFNSSMIYDQQGVSSDKTLYNESLSIIFGMTIPFN
jgi:Outer membrane protein beta-barrel domain